MPRSTEQPMLFLIVTDRPERHWLCAHGNMVPCTDRTCKPGLYTCEQKDILLANPPPGEQPYAIPACEMQGSGRKFVFYPEGEPSEPEQK
jgi:hypothetical protein